MKHILTLATFLAAMGLTMTAARAGTQFNVDFEAMTAGEAPAKASAPADEAATKPTGVTALGEGNSVLVQENFTAGEAKLPGKSVVLNYAANGANTAVGLIFSSPTRAFAAPESYQIAFDLVIADKGLNLATNANALEIRLRNNASGTAAILAQINFNPLRNRLYLSSIAGKVDSTVVPDVWQRDKVMKVQVLFDAKTSQVKTSIDGKEVGVMTLQGVEESDRGVRTFELRSGSTKGGFVAAIDNLVAGPVQ